MLYLARHRRKPPGRWAPLTALAAGLACVAGLTVAVTGLTRSGPLPDPRATSIPATVRATVPTLTGFRHVKPLRRSVPVRIRIPAIGVDAPVSELGLNTDGTVQVPPLDDHNLAGWYKYGPAPGQRGASVILGHVDSITGISVFFRLKQLRPGELIYLTLTDGKTATFTVDGVQKAAKSAFPTRAVYGKLAYPALRLITCGGAFDPGTGHYADNIIAYAHMI